MYLFEYSRLYTYDYIEFDNVYQAKLLKQITDRKNKKIISDLVILEGQPRPGDGAVVNPNEGKKLTNMRAASADSTVRITPPTRMSLEESLEFIREDELVEVTPKSIRLRKKILKSNQCIFR